MSARDGKPRTKPLAYTVKAWRTARGLSTAAAADHLEMPVRTLEGIEQGRPFRYEKILRLALNSA
jgi:transcriptional regulator with XRE-family HTH domain